ncbi:hypothetical protein Tco_0956192 [Tanacetum coccineum]|uniref:Uncharacterized protein n=1 Tax=Tanacetum coccineum TaxID=301880 RepID=A0ABQ5E9B9_9ASTR
MSNSNTNLQTQSSNALHNAIMEAGSKDCPQMLAPGNYIQWKSRIKRYIDTKPNIKLIHYCLQNPPYTYQWAEKIVPVAEVVLKQLQKDDEGACPKSVVYVTNHQDQCPVLTSTYTSMAKNEVNEIQTERLARTLIHLHLLLNNNQFPIIKTILLKKTLNILHQFPNSYKKQRKSNCYLLLLLLCIQNLLRLLKDERNVKAEKELTNSGFNFSLVQENLQPTNTTFEIPSNTSRANQDISQELNKENWVWDNQRAINVAGARENVGTSGRAKCLGFSVTTARIWRMYQGILERMILMHESDGSELEQLYVHGKLQEVEIDCAKAKGDLMSYKIDFAKSSNAYTQQINDLNQTISDMKKELCAHQETISIMSQAKEAQIKLYKTREDKELDKVIALENKVKVLNDIVYKTGQSVQTMNMLNRNCKTSFAKPEFLKKAQRANPRLYDIGCYNDNLALMLAPDSDETIRLDKERRSKLSDLIRPFDYAQLNNLYDLFVPQREKSAQHNFPKMSTMSQSSTNNEFSKESFRKQPTLLEKRIDESIPWDKKCQSSKELFKIKKCVGTIFDGVERCKQTIAKRTYFGNIDPFIQNTIEGNFGPQISKINVDLERFHLCLKEEMVADLKYVNSLEDEVDNLKSQMETQKHSF